MARRAKILLVGTLVAILPCGAATSQTLPSTALNNQVQLGDVFSQQTLNVVEVTEQTSADTSATGNAFEGSTSLNDLDVRSNQTASGAVTGNTLVNVAGNSGATVALSTAATGNSAGGTVYGGTLTGVYNQNTGPTTISSVSHIEAPDGQAGNVDTISQAVGNSQAFGLSYGSAGLRTNQTNEATVTSDGGGVYGYVSGSANFSAVTSANDVTMSNDNGSAARMISTQTNNADRTQASQFTAFGNVQDTTTSATVAGNNINAYNQGYLLDITSQQTNNAYVRAQGSSSAYQFGSATASAYGVGNALAAGDVGGEVILDTTQINDGGGIEATAEFTGTDGYDGIATSTAMGNSISGYSCSDCSGRMTVANSQTNYSDVGAQSVSTITATGRSATGVSKAVGNNATYYVSRPGE